MRVPAVFFRRIFAVAAVAACSMAIAQSPARPKPAVDDSPRFEIRRFVFDGATLVPLETLEADTRPYTGRDRVFADVQRALEAVERA